MKFQVNILCSTVIMRGDQPTDRPSNIVDCRDSRRIQRCMSNSCLFQKKSENEFAISKRCIVCLYWVAYLDNWSIKKPPYPYPPPDCIPRPFKSLPLIKWPAVFLINSIDWLICVIKLVTASTSHPERFCSIFRAPKKYPIKGWFNQSVLTKKTCRRLYAYEISSHLGKYFRSY